MVMAESATVREPRRYPLKLAILYQRAGTRSVPLCMGWTRDLSEGGACVDFPERLEAGTVLRLSFGAEHNGLELRAEVIWADTPGSASGSTLHGLAFPALSGAQRQGLQRLLHARGLARRAGGRYAVELAITCQRKGSPAPPLQGQIEDLGLGGLRLRLPQTMDPGTLLALRFTAGPEEVIAEGVVIWVESPAESRTDELIRHGVHFTVLAPGCEATLGLLLAERQ